VTLEPGKHVQVNPTGQALGRPGPAATGHTCLSWQGSDVVCRFKSDYNHLRMNFIAIKDLKQPRRLKERLREERELLLTSDGQPVAVIVHVDTADDPEAVIRSIRDARSRLALSRIREAARRGGTSRMTRAEVNREVEAARAERRRRR
jgi:hypothetical protein